MYKVGLIGAGIIAHSHLQAISRMPGLQASAVAEIDPVKAAAVAEQYAIKAYGDYREMLAAERPDIAIVSLPHDLHRESALECIRFGCHLLLEKPMALNTAECRDINAAARRRGIRLMVGHTQHYIAENLAAKRLIEEGGLGELLMINDVRHKFYFAAERPRWFLDKDRAGGGILMNLGSHSVDKIQWLTNSRVAKVKASLHFAEGLNRLEGCGVVCLETTAGVRAVMFQSGYPGVDNEEMELVFTRGMIKLRTNESVWVSRNGVYERLELPPPEDPYVLQLRDLLAYIERGVEPDCSGGYAASVIAAIEAIYASAESGTEASVGQGGRDE